MVAAEQHSLHPDPAAPDDRAARVAVQDYVKAIWTVGEDSADAPAAATGAIAEQLGVSPASVSAMIRRLEEDGLVIREPYRGVHLTDRGRTLALEVVRHHRLIETFLARALGMGWDRIHAEAEVLEHHISEELEDLIDAHLGYPEFDPHGHPIPRRDGTVPSRKLAALTDVQIGTHVQIEQVRDEDPAVLRYLADHGLGIGAGLVLSAREPIADTVTVQPKTGTDPVVLGMGLAARIDIITPDQHRGDNDA